MEIVIPSSVSAVLGDGRVENRFLQQGVCATGLISKGLEGEEIVIDDASHLTVEQALPFTPFAPHAHSACEPTTTLPKLITAVKPNYVAAAMRKKIQGMVLVEGVVEANGLIGDARVVTPLDPDLDQEALKAFRGWRFEPGTFMGEPAPVIITVEMHFSRK